MTQQGSTSPSNITDEPGKSLPAPARFLLWFVLGLIVSIGLAWLSIKVQATGQAPLLLSSLVVGGVCGGILVLLTRWTGTGHRRAILLASIGLALVTAGMQHVFAYRSYVANFHDVLTNNPKGALAKSLDADFKHLDFAGYMWAEARRRGNLLMWIVDAVLIVVAAAAAVWLGIKRPHCALCHRWYHVARSGILSGNAAAATCAELGIVLPSDVAVSRFRLLECQCGCSPAQVEVSWKTASGDGGSRIAQLEESQREQFGGAAK